MCQIIAHNCDRLLITFIPETSIWNKTVKTAKDIYVYRHFCNRFILKLKFSIYKSTSPIQMTTHLVSVHQVLSSSLEFWETLAGTQKALGGRPQGLFRLSSHSKKSDRRYKRCGHQSWCFLTHFSWWFPAHVDVTDHLFVICEFNLDRPSLFWPSLCKH